jgi:hypothetical protein
VEKTKLEKFDLFVAERSKAYTESQDPRFSSVSRVALAGGIGIAVSALLFGRSLLRGGDWLVTSGIIGGGTFALVGLGIWLHRSPSTSMAKANTEAKKKLREIAKDPVQKMKLLVAATSLYGPTVPILSRYANDLNVEANPQAILDAKKRHQDLHRFALKSTALVIPVLLFSVAAIASKQRLLVAGGLTAIWGSALGTGLYGLALGLELMRHKAEERRARKEMNYAVAYRLGRDGAAPSEEEGAHLTRLNLSSKEGPKTTLAEVSPEKMQTLLQRCPNLKQLKVNGVGLNSADFDFNRQTHLTHLVVKGGAANLMDRLPDGIKRATLPVINQDVDVSRYRKLKALKVRTVSDDGLKTIQKLRKLQRLSIQEGGGVVRVNQFSDVLEVLEVPRLRPVGNRKQIAYSKLRKVTVGEANAEAISALTELPRLRQVTLKGLPKGDDNIRIALEALFDVKQRQSAELEEVSLNTAEYVTYELFSKLSPEFYHIFVVDKNGKEERIDKPMDYVVKVWQKDRDVTPQRIIIRKPSGDLTKALGGS